MGLRELFSRYKKERLEDNRLICSKCGKRVTAGINENGNTYHLNCKPSIIRGDIPFY